MQNYHVITIGYLPATNTRGARISLKSGRFTGSVILDRDYSMEGTGQAAKYLEGKGFDIIGKAEL